MARSQIYAQWRVSSAADEGVVVLLDGQGGDELFARLSGWPPGAAPQGASRAGCAT